MAETPQMLVPTAIKVAQLPGQVAPFSQPGDEDQGRRDGHGHDRKGVNPDRAHDPQADAPSQQHDCEPLHRPHAGPQAFQEKRAGIPTPLHRQTPRMIAIDIPLIGLLA